MEKSRANTIDANAARMRRRAIERWENEGGSTSTYEPSSTRRPATADHSALERRTGPSSRGRANRPPPCITYRK
jgi:hypothetical protein